MKILDVRYMSMEKKANNMKKDIKTPKHPYTKLFFYLWKYLLTVKVYITGTFIYFLIILIGNNLSGGKSA